MLYLPLYLPLFASAIFALIGMPGHFELLIIAGIVLILFGNRLPGVMRSLGRSVVEFKKGVSGVEDEIDSIKKSIDSAGKSGEKSNSPSGE